MIVSGILQIDEILHPKQRRLVFMGSPAAGKRTISKNPYFPIPQIIRFHDFGEILNKQCNEFNVSHRR